MTRSILANKFVLVLNFVAYLGTRITRESDFVNQEYQRSNLFNIEYSINQNIDITLTH